MPKTSLIDNSTKTNPQNTKNNLLACFAGLSFFLSTIEYLIPKPLPFLRLGLANLPLVLALQFFSFKEYFLLFLLKVFGQSLLTGTLFSYIFLFSFIGSLFSILTMYFLYKAFKKNISYLGISLSGAFASNLVQIILARYFIFGSSAWYIAPVFFLTGIITSSILGVFVNNFNSKSLWIKNLEKTGSIKLNDNQTIKPQALNQQKKHFLRFFIGFLLFLVLVFTKYLTLQIGIVFFALLLNLIDKTKIKILPPLITIVFVVLFNLMLPFGRVVFTIGSFQITEGALLTGLKKAFLLQGLVFLSRWILHYPINLPGRFGRLVSESLSLFAKISKTNFKPSKNGFVQTIDNIMLELD